jgi:hypothetical protein
LNEFTQFYLVIKFLKFFFCWINMRKIRSCQVKTKFRQNLANHGQNLNRIRAKLSQIRYTKNEPDFKPEFGQIRTQIIRSKTNLKRTEFKFVRD